MRNIKITKFEVKNKVDGEKIEIPKVCTTIIRDGVEMVIHEITIDENETIKLRCHIPEDIDKKDCVGNEEVVIDACELFDENIVMTGRNYVLKSSDPALIHGYDSRRFNYITK